ncbi:MAG: hypothetical protein MUC91_00570 [Verrucomicrobia bacterium]|nr:hypothetical protein [Verrucomicrobiota bacterium]
MKPTKFSVLWTFLAFLSAVPSFYAAPRLAWPPWPEATLASYRFNDVDWHSPLLPPAIGFENVRSRSAAVGGQGGLGGVISTNSVDLKTSFEFDRTRAEHSAQFTRPIQNVWEYYDAVLESFRIPTNGHQ